MPLTFIHEEGELYKTVTVADKTFVLKYGYYSEGERALGITTPILPDFQAEPLFDATGAPFVTRIQDSCQHYCPKNGREGDGWCADCIYYPEEHDEIGICGCEKNKLC